jgi:hypothetical protein
VADEGQSWSLAVSKRAVQNTFPSKSPVGNNPLQGTDKAEVVGSTSTSHKTSASPKLALTFAPYFFSRRSISIRVVFTTLPRTSKRTTVFPRAGLRLVKRKLWLGSTFVDRVSRLPAGVVTMTTTFSPDLALVSTPLIVTFVPSFATMSEGDAVSAFDGVDVTVEVLSPLVGAAEVVAGC